MPKRRANGEGNIRKRKDGRWEGRYTAGRDPETGKAIIKNVLGKTQSEVKEKLKKAIEENAGVDYGRAKNYTAGCWLEVWYENYAKIKMRPSSYLNYRGYIRSSCAPIRRWLPGCTPSSARSASKTRFSSAPATAAWWRRSMCRAIPERSEDWC